MRGPVACMHACRRPPGLQGANFREDVACSVAHSSQGQVAQREEHELFLEVDPARGIEQLRGAAEVHVGCVAVALRAPLHKHAS